jgi:hypothetical protein
MTSLQLVTFLLGTALCTTAAAGTTYQLHKCIPIKDGVAAEFIGSHREVRRIALSPQGVQLSGNVKGEASLAQVKELVLTPNLQIIYVDGSTFLFGPIDISCKQLLQKIAGRLVHVSGD